MKGTEKCALIEACKLTFKDEYIQKVEQVMPIKDIDYIILNHNEPDHSGALPALLDINPDMEVIYSKTAKTFVENIVNREFNGRAVGDEDVIELGGKTLRFFHTPFLHWPDTMFTYLVEEKKLSSLAISLGPITAQKGNTSLTKISRTKKRLKKSVRVLLLYDYASL